MVEYRGLMVYCEVKEGKLTSLATELLGYGRKLADDLGEVLSAVLIGSNISTLSQEPITFGADNVYVVDSPLFKDYQTDSYVFAMEKVVKQVTPRILLLEQSSIGRDLAPRLAFRLRTAVTTDCVELTIDSESKQLLQTKPVYGGNARATFVCESYPQMATVRAKTMSPLEPDVSRQGEVIIIDVGLDLSAIRTKLLERLSEEVTGVKLEDAKVVVCGGRGIGGAEGFRQLEELAKMLRGAVGATRPPCDNRWVPTRIQVGLTGKIIAPDIYIGVALSGSSQHLSGCSGAKNIIAINKDPNANIFNVAQFGVVGDWRMVLTAFIKALSDEKE
jgi:electron transfer flavoprotein alpha subunit